MTELSEIQREVDLAYAYYTGGYIDAHVVVEAAREIDYMRGAIHWLLPTLIVDAEVGKLNNLDIVQARKIAIMMELI